MQRYFIDQPLSLSTEFQLSEADTHHLSRVMRTVVGEEVEVVDGNQSVFIAKVIQLGKQAELVTKTDITKNVELPIEATIVCGISKGDKNEQIIKRATELGATHFKFFEARYSVARWSGPKLERKVQRLQEIAKGAAEQSHRQVIPTVEVIDSQTLYDLDADVKMVAYEESAKEGEFLNFKNALKQLNEHQKMIAVFGPEGGIAPEEVQAFVEHGFILAGLGPRILRAETAPMYVMSALSYQFELK